MDNIFHNDKLSISRELKESKFKQNAKVFWYTGLSGSGKSTLAQSFEKKLFAAGYTTIVLDGDNIRSGINNDLGFSLSDRLENIRRVAYIAKLLLDNGVIVIVSFISPTINIREHAKQIIGIDNFLEVYINSPLAVCEMRDVKGLYKKARSGELKEFSGISSPFEAPVHPAIEIDTNGTTVKDCVDKLFTFGSQVLSHSK